MTYSGDCAICPMRAGRQINMDEDIVMLALATQKTFA